MRPRGLDKCLDILSWGIVGLLWINWWKLIRSSFHHCIIWLPGWLKQNCLFLLINSYERLQRSSVFIVKRIIIESNPPVKATRMLWKWQCVTLNYMKIPDLSPFLYTRLGGCTLNLLLILVTKFLLNIKRMIWSDGGEIGGLLSAARSEAFSRLCSREVMVGLLACWY